MRKNSVIREIEKIEGGVTAPKGFFACGRFVHPSEWNFAFVGAEKRVDVAVYFPRKSENEYIQYAQKKAQRGKGRVVSVADGVIEAENLCLARDLCQYASRTFRVPEAEVLPMIVGGVGRKIKSPSFPQVVSGLILEAKDSEAKKGLSGLREALSTAYSYYVGDVQCRFGVLAKRRNLVDGDEWGMIVTTDARISSAMMEKALKTEWKDVALQTTMDLTCLSDCIYMLSSGEAGNYVIDQEDTDYEKFQSAFHLFMKEVAKELLKFTSADRPVEVVVKGAKSKACARQTAKAIVASKVLKGLSEGELCVGAILSIALSMGENCQKEKVSGFLDGSPQLCFLDEGKGLPLSREKVEQYLSQSEIKIEINVGQGNYRASAYGVVPPIKG